MTRALAVGLDAVILNGIFFALSAVVALTASLVGDSEVEIEVTLPAEVAGGSVPFTLIGPGGESRPHAIVVHDGAPRMAEKEPNDGFRQAQPVVVPQVVEGSVSRPQLHFELRMGATPVDPMPLLAS